MAYVGTPLDTTNAFQSLAGKRFSGDASTTDFTLDSSPNSTLDIEVFVENVRQDPNSAYTVSGTTLAFTAAPPSGTNNIYVVHQAKAVGTIDVPSEGVQSGSLSSAFLTGQTDIGGAIADADLFLVDDGAGGTFRKTAASRLKTYIGSLAGIDDQSSSNDDQLTIADGAVTINEDGDDVDFRVETSGNSYTHMIFVESGAGEFNINDSASEGTITMNMAAEDGKLISLKSSDVAHGMTAQAETDTYGMFQKESAASGGLLVQGLSEAVTALRLLGLGTGANNAESTGATGIVDLRASQKDGTDIQNSGGDDNIVTITSGGDGVQVIFKGDGEIFSNQTATVGTYDAYEDAQLIRAYDLSHMKGVIDSKFDKFVKYKQKDLLNAKLIGKDDNGNPTSFVNWTGMSRLHNGAIWQQYEKHNQLLEAVYDLAKEAVGEDKANAILDKHEVKRLQ